MPNKAPAKKTIGKYARAQHGSSTFKSFLFGFVLDSAFFTFSEGRLISRRRNDNFRETPEQQRRRG